MRRHNLWFLHCIPWLKSAEGGKGATNDTFYYFLGDNLWIGLLVIWLYSWARAKLNGIPGARVGLTAQARVPRVKLPLKATNE